MVLAATQLNNGFEQAQRASDTSEEHVHCLPKPLKMAMPRFERRLAFALVSGVQDKQCLGSGAWL